MGFYKIKLLVLTMSIRKLKIYISLHFTTSEAVTSLMENQADGKEKNKQMYIEVRFQRDTSKSRNKEDAIFRLKPNGKQLETSEYVADLSL